MRLDPCYATGGTLRLVTTLGGAPRDILCLSHLRWRFVYQRPNHLMARAARDRRVFWIEPPVLSAGAPCLNIEQPEENLFVAVPHLPEDVPVNGGAPYLRGLLDELFARHAIDRPVLWYYTPLALRFTTHVDPAAVVYDCMDELGAFSQAPPLVAELEPELLRRADLVFAGGESLYENKRAHHARCHLFPSSADVGHFRVARGPLRDPPDQARLGRPRLGYMGVIDERINVELIARVAEVRPEWQLVLLGPVAKIDEASLPRRANIAYLGQKSYEELPAYLAGWDVALMPFAHNRSTRLISPTKTLEYLAAGRPVVSTSVRDVVHRYGESGLVRIADSVDGWVGAVEDALVEDSGRRESLADAFLTDLSWDRSWAAMASLVRDAVRTREGASRGRRPGSPVQGDHFPGSVSLTAGTAEG
ncbi:MAG: glycosyltransferase [Chloroflexota bacterium]|nr:glycosyltransferase [Chloroflexota bacterium]